MSKVSACSAESVDHLLYGCKKSCYEYMVMHLKFPIFETGVQSAIIFHICAHDQPLAKSDSTVVIAYSSCITVEF
jgi:hypothetical protein